MAGQHRRLRLVLGLVAAVLVVLGSSGVAPRPTTAASSWDGSLDLYRAGTFTTQKSWLWCTAAGVQVASNIVEREADHSTSGQRRYFEWMRGHNRYDLPLSAGVDAAGWTAGMQHFVDARYRLVASKSFDSALRLAAQRMRATNLPVALTVEHGNHGWILTGFSATADPATDKDFKVTSVRVVGPLYGLQSRTYGYDMPPGTSLTTKQLRGFFTPWWYAPKRMVWDGLYISIQPVPAKPPQIAKSLPVTLPSARPSASASPTPSPQPAAAIDPTTRPAPSVAAPTAGIEESVEAAERSAGDGTWPIGILGLLAILASIALLARGISVRKRPSPG